MYKLNGIVVGEQETFNVCIDPTNNIDDMKKKVKEENSEIPCYAKKLQIYKLDENAPLDKVRPHNEETEVGVSDTEISAINDLKDPKHYGYAYPLKGTLQLSQCWSRSPQLSERLHFMVVVPKDRSQNETLQITVILTAIGIADMFRRVPMSFKDPSTIRDLSVQLRGLPLPARSVFEINDAQGRPVKEEETLIEGATYQARFHATPPATPNPPDTTRAVPLIYRTRAIKTILTQLMRDNVVRVRAPPACGKTIIAEQVEEWFKFYFDELHHINLGWYRKPSTAMDQIFANHPILLNLRDLIEREKRTLIIVDEAQTLNCIDEDHTFWGALKHMIDHRSNKSLYILMLGVYGEGPSSIAYNRILSSPIVLPTLDFPTIHLDDEEFDVMVDQFNMHTRGMQLTGSCRDYIRSFLGGHIGLVTSLLNFLDQNPTSHKLRTVLAQAPENQIQIHTLDFITDHAFRVLLSIRSMPTIGYLTVSKVPHLLEVMQILLLNGGTLEKFPLDDRHTEAIACLLTSFCITSNGGNWTFASPFIQFGLLRTWRMPADSLPDFQDFIQHCVQSLDYVELGRSRSSSFAGLVHEDPFKCALYARMHSYLPGRERVDPEVGRFFGPSGRVDLWIWPAKWAIEILRNYNAVQQHVKRLTATSSSLPIEQHIVLNFVQEQDPSLQQLSIREISQQQHQDQKIVWHIHWSPRARLIVLRRNTGPAERLPLHETSLVIKPAVSV